MRRAATGLGYRDSNATKAVRNEMHRPTLQASPSLILKLDGYRDLLDARRTTYGRAKGEGALTAADENLVRAVLIAQLGSVALSRLELDRDLLLVEEVDSLEDDL
jgi:hypothetical protein